MSDYVYLYLTRTASTGRRRGVEWQRDSLDIIQKRRGWEAKEEHNVLKKRKSIFSRLQFRFSSLALGLISDMVSCCITISDLCRCVNIRLLQTDADSIIFHHSGFFQQGKVTAPLQRWFGGSYVWTYATQNYYYIQSIAGISLAILYAVTFNNC